MKTEKLAKILKALSHPKRLELYMAIARQDQSNFESDDHCACFMGSLMQKLNIGAPTVSHHLKELSNADLIRTERNGKYLVARLNRDTMAAVRQVLGEI